MYTNTDQDTGNDEIADVVARLEAKASEESASNEPEKPETEPAPEGGDESEGTEESGEETSTDEEPEGDDTGQDEDEATEEESEQPASKRFAALARRESKLVREKQSLQAERQRLDQERQALQQFAQLPDLAKQDPLRALQALGLSYEQVTEALISGKGAAQAAPVTRDDLSELEQRLKKEREDLETQRQVEAFKREIDDHIRKEADQYELIHLQGKSTLVMEVIEEAYQQHGRLLEIDEAAKLVEEHLEEEASKLLKAKKLGAKQKSAKPQPKAKPRNTIAGMGTSKGSLGPADSFSDPDEEDFQRAISAYHKARAR